MKRILEVATAAAVATTTLVAIAATQPAVGSAPSATWQAAGTTHVPHELAHSATGLHGGGVLVAGGYSNGNSTAAADRYDPKSNTWSATADMTASRASHSATALHSGSVVVAGGFDQVDCPSTCQVTVHASSELFEPKTGAWTPVAAMSGPRTHHQHGSVLLHDGGVLVTGGLSDTAVLASTEIYRPATGAWVPAAAMAVPRYGHVATRLHNGSVLVVGGVGSDGAPLASAELYDPHSDTWAPTGPMSGPRVDFTATLLHDGEVLAAGGHATASPPPGAFPAVATAETYDPKTGTWTPTDAMTSPRFGHVAVRLHHGQVLLAGGEDMDVHPVSSAELYDAGTRSWTATGAMATARAFPVGVPVAGGGALVVGGFVIHQGLSSAERYTS